MDKVAGIVVIGVIAGGALIGTKIYGSNEKKNAKKRTEQKYREKDVEDDEVDVEGEENEDDDDEVDVEGEENEDDDDDEERRERQKRRREQEEREWWAEEARKQREREEYEWWVWQRELKERERQANEERERRERQERVRRANEERERRERQDRERQVNEERERRKRQERERQVNEERERRERQEREKQVNEERERRERQDRERQVNEERERRKQEEREYKEKARQAEIANHQEASQGNSSGAPQPPQENKNKYNSTKKMTNQEYFDKFMGLLRKLSQTIYGSDKGPILKLFVEPKFTEGQKKYLIKVIKTLENFDTLEAVLEIVIIIFKDHMSSDINFENFLSLLEFVRSYLNDKVNEIQTETDEYMEGTYEERRAQILRDVMTDSGLVVRMVVLLFRQLAAEIAAECAAPNNLSPDFRDIFAKVYHYYKHRRIPDLPDYENKNIRVPDEDKPFLPENDILSVKQYFYWAKQYLAKLKNNETYKEEVENASPTVTVTFRYEVFVVLFGRRLRIVVKLRDGKLVLSTVFFDDNCYPDDAEDFEDLDIQKPKKPY